MAESREGPPLSAPSAEVFVGKSELAALMRAYDWARSPLGPVEQWPQALITCVRIMLTSRQPMWLGWSDDLTFLYNDPYRAILGSKHPQALGQPTATVWREIWHDIAPRIEATLGGDEGTYDEALLLIMERHGYPEETYYTFSYSHVPDDAGGVGGLFCANSEDTRQVIGERQMALLRELALQTVNAHTVDAVCTRAAASLATNAFDIPFALLYLVDPAHTHATLAASTLDTTAHAAAPATLPLDSAARWPLDDVLRSKLPCLIDDLSPLAPLPAGAWDRPPARAIALPIAPAGQDGCASVLIVGLSPYRAYDEEYAGFLGLVAGQIGAALASAQAYVAERERAESLAALDRAKTAFFSEVSHEFRTPLTLLLGPIGDLLDGGAGTLPPAAQRELALAQRNGLRLLKLVNTLLDFARIEAGRVDAVFAPTDLAALTADLASVFRAALERAGLTLTVDCPPLPQPIYVDQEMWEKVVFNLLSNAFKYTLAGAISLRLRWCDDHVELAIADTGTGIPASELPQLFERFHRVRGATARTQEGSGIGLALVQELVRLHGGTIAVASTLGEGTTFTIALPTGSAHLPLERLSALRQLPSTALGAAPFLAEAERWQGVGPAFPEADGVSLELPAVDPPPAAAASALGAGNARILLADDNVDMRDYVARLLGQHWQVDAVADGPAALAFARENPPDLVLSDVMMPVLDGLGLLVALRSDPRTAQIPVLLLSARAGEEARVEGLAAGADDYLVKPFSARELLARVGAHLELARVRAAAAAQERQARTAAQEALRVRDEFIAAVSHDLRTPLSTILGMAQLLRRQIARLELAAAPRLEERVQTVEQAATRMSAMVNELLDVSRLEAGRPLDLQVEEIDLAQLTRRLVREHQRGAPGYVLQIDLPESVSGIWDPARIERVISNLLTNAIKYSSPGGAIAVTLTEAATESGIVWAELAVADNGIGIPAADLPHVFERFHRGANVSGRIGGAGIGLASARRIAEQHGGTLSVASEEGVGTTVTLRLPQSTAPGPAASNA